MYGIGAHGKTHDLKPIIIPAQIFKYFPATPATTPDQKTEEPAP